MNRRVTQAEKPILDVHGRLIGAVRVSFNERVPLTGQETEELAKLAADALGTRLRHHTRKEE